MKKNCIIIRYAAGIPLYVLGAVLAATHPVASMGVLLGLLLLEVVLALLESKRFLDFRVLFSVSWLLGLSLSTLKLSNLQSVWGAKTWTVLALMYFMFLIGYDFVSFLLQKRDLKKKKEVKPENGQDVKSLAKEELYPRRILQVILLFFIAGFLGFMLEAVKFHFVFPIINTVPHAYTEFHITGVHYFVVSIMFVHPLSVMYFMKKEKVKFTDFLILVPINFLSILVPFLLLSKFQILLSLGLPILTWVLIQKKVKKLVLIGLSIVAVILGVFLFTYMVSKRHYPDGYLESIFQFKQSGTPMGIQYTYMYIVNNLENVNMLVENLQHHSMGIRQLFPVFALTGTKFIPAVRELMAVENYITIEELTTTSIIYDAYGDFGMVGVALFGLLIGAASNAVTYLMLKRKTVFSVLMYLQFAIYMSLAFFSTWFSNPTTWFWFVMTFIAGLYATKEKKKLKVSLAEI